MRTSPTGYLYAFSGEAMTEACTFHELKRLAQESKRILLTGPVDPDGDSIGSCLALARILEQVCGAQVVVAGIVAPRYAGLPFVERMIPDNEVTGPFDMAVVLDGDQRRLCPPVGALFQASPVRVLVDHHSSTSREGYTLTLLDTDVASTCEIVFHLVEAWGLSLDRDMAALLYTGMIFDTGAFRHSNTTPTTHRIASTLIGVGIDHSAIVTRILVERNQAALRLMGRVLASACFAEGGRVVLGAIPLALSAELGTAWSDAEGIVDMLVYTEGVEAAVLAVERAPAMVKLSLRSRGGVNVARVARALHPSGGGHFRAAGVVLEEPLEGVLERVQCALTQALGQRE